MALRISGEVVCWGSDQWGQITPPQDLGACSAVACGWDHSLAIRSDGRVVGWGRNDSLQVTIPSDLASASQVAAGSAHSLALQVNGVVRGWGSNSFGQATIPPNLGTCSQIAAGGFHSVALRVDGSVAAWGMNQQTVGVVGSSKARSFVLDAKNGIDSVDILLCGDSNTGFSTGSDNSSMDGWNDGFTVALRDIGVKEFATPLLPVSTIGPPIGVDSFQSAMPLGRGSTSDSAPAFLTSGSLDAPSELSQWLSPSPDPAVSGLYTTGTPFDFGWIAAQPNPFFADNAGVYITAASSIGVTNELIYRVLRSSVAAADQPGSYFQSWRDVNGTVLVPPVLRSASAPQYGWMSDELVLAADPSRGSSTIHADLGGNAYSGSSGITGNIGFGLQSVYRRERGFAVQPLEFHGGATMTTIARDVAQMPLDSRMTWLRELRARQIAAGGSGRVIVFIQGGINRDAGLPQSWGSAILSLQGAVEEAWTALGAPLENLTFVAMVSHPTTSFDAAMREIREFADSMVLAQPNLTIVNLSKLTSSEELQIKNWYSDSLSHLKSSGYTSLAIRIVRDLVGGSGACDVPTALGSAGACTAIAAGGQHTIALRANGAVVAWGAPCNGQCDLTISHTAIPQIAAGRDHTILRHFSGDLVAVGANTRGQCDAPANLRNTRLIAAGAAHTIAIADRLLPCLGDTNFDWVVDSADITAVLSGWGSGNIGDVTGDGMTDGQDITAIFSSWGNCF
ncbi:MAG: hypothetical protein EXS17_00930 [Phycisphaerales bacterium]|nr:hypothetical protein [Phycisphaerales bacterium]